MNRRTFAVAAVVAALTASAHAGDPARTKEVPLPIAPERPLELRALFDHAPGVITETGNGVMTGPAQADVIVARIGTDGKLVKACVDSEAAARRFLETPIEKVEARKVKEH